MAHMFHSLGDVGVSQLKLIESHKGEVRLAFTKGNWRAWVEGVVDADPEASIDKAVDALYRKVGL